MEDNKEIQELLKTHIEKVDQLVELFLAIISEEIEGEEPDDEDVFDSDVPENRILEYSKAPQNPFQNYFG